MRILGPLVLILAAVVPLRADEWPVARAPSTEPQPYRFDPQHLRDIPKEYLDDYGAVTLYSGTTHRILADGTQETIVHEVTRLNGRKAVEDLGEYRYASYVPAWQKFVLNEARIRKADGAVVEVEPRHVLIRDAAGDDALIYDVSKQVTISFPNLAVGDVYEVKWTSRGTNPEFGSEFFSRYSFGDDRYPIVRDVWHIALPKERTLHVGAVRAPLKPEVRDEGDVRHYRWTATNRPPPPRDEDAPPKDEFRWQAAASTYRDWKAVAEWKSRMRAECWKCTDDIKAVVRDACKDRVRPAEKAAALVHWIRRNVRYVSRGPGGAGYIPHPPLQVLRNRFGDCKDQSQLLAVMLREIGIDPWLVTLGVQGDGQVLPDVPSPWGTHAIVMAEIDGKEHWIDPTYSDAPWNFLPRSARDRRCYMTRGDEFRLSRTPPLRPSDWQAEQSSKIQIQLDGSSHVFRAGLWRGAAAVQRRGTWFETPSGERLRLATNEIKDAFSRARLWKLNIDEGSLADAERPVGAAVEFVVPNHFSGDEDREGSLSDSVTWNRLVGFAFDPERKLPLDLGYPFESKHRFVVELPPGYRLDAPPTDMTAHSEWGEFERKVEPMAADQPRTLRFSMRTRLSRSRIETADLRSFGAFQEEVTRGYRVHLALRLADDLLDLPVLEGIARRESVPHAARLLGRLLLKQGKRDDAARTLAAALEHHPGDRTLWELRAKAVRDFPDELGVAEAMAKRFSEDDDLKVRLGKLLVRKGSPAEARKILTPLLGRESATLRAQIHLELSRLCVADSDFVAAQKYWEAAELNDPLAVATADALLLSGRIAARLQGPEAAIAPYRVAYEAEPTRIDVALALASALIDDGKIKEALPPLRAASALADKDVAFMAAVAELHLRANRLHDAIDFANRAMEANDTSPTALIVRGAVEVVRRDPNGIADLHKAVDLTKGKDPRPLLWLHAAYRRDGDAARAAAIRERLGPGDFDSRIEAIRNIFARSAK